MASMTPPFCRSPVLVEEPPLVDENSSPVQELAAKWHALDEASKATVMDTPPLRVPAGLRLPLEETWRTVSPHAHEEKDVLQQTNRTLSPPPLSPHRQGPILARLPNRVVSPNVANADSPPTLRSHSSTSVLERLASNLDRTLSPPRIAEKRDAFLFEAPPRFNFESSADKFKAAMNSSVAEAFPRSIELGTEGVSPLQRQGCSVTCSAHGDKAVAVLTKPLHSQALVGPPFRCASPPVVRRSSVGSSSPMHSGWKQGVASTASGKPACSQTTASMIPRLSNGGLWSKSEEGKPPTVKMPEDPLQRLAKEVQVLEQLKAAVVAQEERVRQLRRDVQYVTPRARPKTVGVASPQVAQYPSSLTTGMQQAPLAFPTTAPRLSCNSVCRSIHATPGTTAIAQSLSHYRRAKRVGSASPSRAEVEPRPTQGGSVVLSQTSQPPSEDTKPQCSAFAQRGPSPLLAPATRKAHSEVQNICQTPSGWPSPTAIFCRAEAPHILHQPLRLPK